VEHQVGDGRQALTGVLVAIPLGVHAAQGFDLRDQRLSLIDRMPLVLVLSLAMILDWIQIFDYGIKECKQRISVLLPEMLKLNFGWIV
jgi:hypothetical protein